MMLIIGTAAEGDSENLLKDCNRGTATPGLS
jgi:hypothetical protein